MRKWLLVLLVSSLMLSVTPAAHAQGDHEQLHLFPTEPPQLPPPPVRPTAGPPKVYTADLASGQAVAMMSHPDDVKVYISLFQDASLRDACVEAWLSSGPFDVIDLTPKAAKALADFTDPTSPDQGSASLICKGAEGSLVVIKLQGSEDMALVHVKGGGALVTTLTQEERAIFANHLRSCVEDILEALS